MGFANSESVPSDFAVEPIQYLKENTEISSEYYRDYQTIVSREEFAYYSVILYYKLINMPMDISIKEPNKFMDTNNNYVLKANELGIVKGIDDKHFSPQEPVSREQAAELFVRILQKSNIPFNTDDTGYLVFNDESSISDWAKEGVKRAYHIGIINGVSTNTIAPQQNITREQALTLIYNILDNLERIKKGYTRGSVISTPTLKYSGVGQYDTGWCEEAYYSTPAVADLNGDGRLEIIFSAYSIVNADAATGNVNWRISSGFDRSSPDAKYTGRTWSNIIIKDVDGDGKLEIITGHSNGIVSVYNNEGYFKPGWPQKPTENEIKSVRAYDLDNDGTDEIIVAAAIENSTNIWVYEHNGSLRTGWPQLNDQTDAVKNPVLKSTGYAWGVFADNISVGDINGDGMAEIVVPSDVPFICAYDSFGNLIEANPMYGGRSWGKIGGWEDAAFESKVENEGWGVSIDWRTGQEIDLFSLPRSERYTVNFAFGKSVIADLDGNGTNEVVVTGNVYDRAYGFPPPGKYQGLFVFNGDRTRFRNQKYDWSQIPVDTGEPLSEDWNEIELCIPAPAVEDIDLNGEKEIIYPTYDGRIQCFWLDKTSWAYSVYDGYTKEFASSPAVVDLNNDGYKEIIFTTFTAKNSSKTGSLYILSHKGKLIHKVELPKSLGGTTIPNGGLAAPLVSDVDGDGLFEIVVNSHLSGLVVYDLN